MGKHDDDIVRSASEHVFALFRDAGPEGSLVYHSYDRARELARATRQIARGAGLPDEQTRIALLAAWFHGAGYATGTTGNGAESASVARRFLAERGEPTQLAEAVVECMRGAEDGIVASAAQEVLHDALLVPTADKGYVRELRLLRLEQERRGGTPMSDVEWTERSIRFLDQHPFRTRHAQLEYNRGRAQNLVRLHNLLREQQEETDARREQDDKATKGISRTVESLYSDMTKNQLRLLGTADRRTNTMVHVNAIMISLVVGLLLRHIEANRNLLVPTLMMLTVNVGAILISIISMRVPRARRRILGVDPGEHDSNLLALANPMGITREQYFESMEALARDLPALRKAMIESTWYLRRMLQWRAQMLRLTYDVFLGGLVVTLIAFAVAVVLGR